MTLKAELRRVNEMDEDYPHLLKSVGVDTYATKESVAAKEVNFEEPTSSSSSFEPTRSFKGNATMVKEESSIIVIQQQFKAPIVISLLDSQPIRRFSERTLILKSWTLRHSKLA